MTEYVHIYTIVWEDADGVLQSHMTEDSQQAEDCARNGAHVTAVTHAVED